MPNQKGPFQKENKSFNHHFSGGKQAFWGAKGMFMFVCVSGRYKKPLATSP